MKNKIAKFERDLVKEDHTYSSTESKNLGENTNVCKILRLLGVISTLALDRLLSNLKSLFKLGCSCYRC